METLRICQQCRKPLPHNAPEGLCPECLAQVALGTETTTPGASINVNPLAKAAPGTRVPPNSADLAAQFPHLEILQLLGMGGMGMVYKARQPRLDRLVALKILPIDSLPDTSFAERFEREARALARLNHPGIVTLYDFGQTQEYFYFIMEFVDGMNLRQLIQAKSLGPRQALELVTQICTALQFAHDEKIVHRDIKPENILITKKGQVKIADFGLAKLIGGQPDTSLTASQMVMGTLNYMAPEQRENTKDVDHRADIYSLGVVFYELLTGEVPMGRFEPPSKKVQIDVRLDEVVLHALEREPARRYQHVSEVKSNVETITASMPREKSAAGAPESFKPQPASGIGTHVPKRFAIGLVAGAFAMLLICVGLIFALAWKMNNRKSAGNPVGPAPALAAHTGTATAFCPMVGDEAVTQALKPIRQQFNVPAMAVAVVTSDGIKYVGAVGVRKRGTDIPVGLDDLWHLGSDTKAMTSTLIARLVERGQLKWDSTLGEVFPDLAPQMNPEFKKVTLLQLLSHRGALPENLNLYNYLGNDVESLRRRAVRDELAEQPVSTAGSQFAYSNLGDIIAGAVVEKVTGESWENAISNEVFKPLEMKSAGFGGTGTPGQIDQPWPHTADGRPTAKNGPDMDNPPVMGPAGRVHCSIQDWARFIQDQLRGARGESGTLLKPASYWTLQNPPFGGDYALGWIVTQRDWAGGKALNHGGDNTMNCANVWIAPQENFAILVCVNQSGDAAFQASNAAVGAMIDLLKKRDKSK
jgi:CubicO group peptidase (beta-lactamase class C family)/tRNA A-37 threonylcarbamoyl transferase component Bud32